MRRLRLLFLIPTLTAGGAERFIVTLLRHIDRQRFEPILAVVDMRDGVFRSELPTDIPLIDLDCGRVRYAVPKVMALVWRIRPDVVFSTLGHMNIALAMCRPFMPRSIRYIGRETSIVSNVVRDAQCPRCWAWTYRRIYPRFDQVVCQSHYMAKDLQNNFSLHPSLTTVINNPVDIEHIRHLSGQPQPEFDDYYLQRGADTILLVAAGRLVDVKGFDLLIGAMALCRDLAIRLLILGDGPERSRLEALSIDLSIDERVGFAGFQSNPYPFIAQADAFVLSSRYEGFPNVVLEAMACGTPVISTPATGGTQEILEGIGGCIMAEEISSESLASAIRRWVASPRLRLDRSHVERYRAEKIVAAYERLLSGEKNSIEQ